ncbi:hypothetical protein [Streptomyces maremycinicus]|uniref:hypothetical protein n=1 Tax=Streptomyces maremycinicus TaxID=1679753 RepID=UPI0013311FB3|nr:hypothetical protein [Streptomyces sp. NBRC 110468]
MNIVPGGQRASTHSGMATTYRPGSTSGTATAQAPRPMEALLSGHMELLTSIGR